METLIAADFGAPQLRQRLICVGLRRTSSTSPADFYRFPWPQPTHSGPHETRTRYDRTLPPHVTAGEALGDLDRPDQPARARRGRQGHLRGGAAGSPTRRQLPLLDGPSRPSRSALRVAQALLDLPAQAPSRQAVADDPRPARPLGRAVPLGQSPPAGGRAEAADDVPRRVQGARQPARTAAPARQRRSAASSARSSPRRSRASWRGSALATWPASA